MVFWRLSRAYRGPEDHFFQRYGDRRTLKLSKFRADTSWILCCDLWPASGACSTIRVSLGKQKGVIVIPSDAGKFHFEFGVQEMVLDPAAPGFNTLLRIRALVMPVKLKIWATQLVSWKELIRASVKERKQAFTPLFWKQLYRTSRPLLWHHLNRAASIKKKTSSYWVHKNDEVLKEDFRSLWVVSRLFMHNDWRDIIKFLQEHFQINTSLNPLFDDKALIRSSSRKLEDLIKNWGNGRYVPFYFPFENWNKFKHGRPDFIRGVGGWISIKNLPAIGNYFGGLENISLEHYECDQCVGS